MCPTFVFATECFDKSLSEIKSSSTSFGFIDSPLFLILSLLEISIELSQLCIQLPDNFLHIVEFNSGNLKLLFGFLELFTQWANFLDDVEEFDYVDDPRAETGCCLGFVLYDSWVELWIREIIFLDNCNISWRKLIGIYDLLKAKQCSHECLWILHDFLGCFPIELLGLLAGFVRINFLEEP